MGNIKPRGLNVNDNTNCRRGVEGVMAGIVTSSSEKSKRVSDSLTQKGGFGHYPTPPPPAEMKLFLPLLYDKILNPRRVNVSKDIEMP